jgi:hypothetical protein
MPDDGSRPTMPSAVPIANLVDDVTTRNLADTAPDLPFIYIDLSAVDQEHKTITGARRLIGADAPSRARQVVRSGDVLVSTVRPNLNGVAVVGNEYDGAIASTGFCVLRPRKGELDTSFLFHWVRSKSFITAMVRQATGASYPAISDGIVRKSLIASPPLSEQRRLAAILDQADALRMKRREALTQLDQMAQAIFVAMFGDPILNPFMFPMAQLKEVGQVSTGATPPGHAEGMFGGDIPFVTPGDLGTAEPVRRHVTEQGADAIRTVRKGAALVCCIGATIGKMDKARARSSFNQQINAVEWTNLVADDYGFHALRFLKEKIVLRGTSTTLPILIRADQNPRSASSSAA